MYYHDGAGHFAIDKTLESISSHYWFPAMRAYVKNYIKWCLGCLYNKAPSGKQPRRLNPIETSQAAKHPNEHVAYRPLGSICYEC